MGIAVPVVEHRTALDALLGDLAVDVDRSTHRLRGLDGQFEGIEESPGIAVSNVHQVIEGVRIELNAVVAVAPLAISQRCSRHLDKLRFGVGPELEYAAAAHQRPIHLEVGVLGGGTDQDHGTVLHPGEQRILLRLIEAVHLVDEENGAAPLEVEPLPRRRHRLANLLDARKHRIEADEGGLGGVGDDPRQGGLTGAGRAVEDQAREAIGLDRPSQQPPRPQDVRLTDEFVEDPGAHPGCKGLGIGGAKEGVGGVVHLDHYCTGPDVEIPGPLAISRAPETVRGQPLRCALESLSPLDLLR